MIFIAMGLLNGVLISLARILNGRLSSHRGAFYSSWINHIVGFLFLTLLLFVVQGMPVPLQSIPWYLYLGGVIGGIYVGLNSFVVTRIGVTTSTLLVIAGQLLVSVLIDYGLGNVALAVNLQTGLLIVGCGLVVAGFNLMSEGK